MEARALQIYTHWQGLGWHKARALHLKMLGFAGLQRLLRMHKVLAALHVDAGRAVRLLCFPAGLLAGLELFLVVYFGSPAGEMLAGNFIIAYVRWRVQFFSKLISRMEHGMARRG